MFGLEVLLFIILISSLSYPSYYRYIRHNEADRYWSFWNFSHSIYSRTRFYDLKGHIFLCYNKLKTLGREDPAWRMDQLIHGAKAYFELIQAAWSDQDINRLSQLLHPQLFPSWRQKILEQKNAGHREKVSIESIISIDVVNLTDHPNDDHDRVTLRIEARYRKTKMSLAGYELARSQQHVVEYWTLGRVQSFWRLITITAQIEYERAHAA